MKKDIHPEYRLVVFQDMSTKDYLLVRSTAETEETIEIEGKTYPLVSVEVSSTSHPFYTGKQKIVDSTGRVDRFKKLTAKMETARAQRAKIEEAKKKKAASKTNKAEKSGKEKIIKKITT